MSLSTVFDAKNILFIIALSALCNGCSDRESSVQKTITQQSEAPEQQVGLPLDHSSNQNEVFDIPKDWMNKWKDGLNDDEFQLAQKLSLQGEEQDAKLTTEIGGIITSPKEFSTDQIDKSFDNLLKLTVNMNLLRWIRGAGNRRITFNPTIKTWGLLNDEVVKPGSELDTAITNLAKRAASKPGCELAYMQIEGISPIFWYEYTLAKIEAEKQSCGGLHFFLTTHDYSLPRDKQKIGWLDEEWREQTERVDRLKRYVGNEEYSFIHKELVDGIDGGCEPSVPSLANAWTLEPGTHLRSCEPSVPSLANALTLEPGAHLRPCEPSIPSLANALGICPWRTKNDRSEYEKEMLDKDKGRFRYFPIEMNDGASIVEIETAINIIARKLVAGPSDISFAARKDAEFYPVGYWVSPGKTKVVFQLVETTIFYPWPRDVPFTQRKTILISVTSKESRYINVPGNYGQYDDGQVVGITDRDKDENIEVWITATWGECDGEELKPGIDCSIPHYYMAEQFGNYLGGFIQGLGVETTASKGPALQLNFNGNATQPTH